LKEGSTEGTTLGVTAGVGVSNCNEGRVIAVGGATEVKGSKVLVLITVPTPPTSEGVVLVIAGGEIIDGTGTVHISSGLIPYIAGIRPEVPTVRVLTGGIRVLGVVIVGVRPPVIVMLEGILTVVTAVPIPVPPAGAVVP